MKNSVILHAFFCLLFSGFLLQGITAQASRFSVEKYISKSDTLNYRFLYPDSDTLRKYPLVIFLHGSGERGSDNEAQLKWGVMNFATDKAMSGRPAFLIAPQCPKNEQWASIDRNAKSKTISLKADPSRSMRLLFELINDCIKKFNIDTSRIYITGLSMGGFGTFDAIERNPNLFAAAVPVCGGGDVSRAQTIAHIPTWIFHGSEDPAVNPALSMEMAAALFKAGAHPGLTMYPATGHFSWLAAYSDEAMMEWLFAQHK